MSILTPDITSMPRMHRLRAAFTTALLLTLAALLVMASAVPSEAASHRRNARLVAPTSVTVAGTTCVAVGDGNYDVTVTFAVTGGRYLNLGSPENTAGVLNGQARYDNVRNGGTREVTSTSHYHSYPGYDDDHSIAVTDTFTYQHAIAPITAQRDAVSLRSVRRLSRDIEVTFTCP